MYCDFFIHMFLFHLMLIMFWVRFSLVTTLTWQEKESIIQAESDDGIRANKYIWGAAQNYVNLSKTELSSNLKPLT